MVNYDSVLELEPPHGFLIAQGKQTAIARIDPLDTEKSYLVACNGEAFGIATLEQPAQIKTKDFDAEDWLNQHRITQRERRQWWPESEAFYVYRFKEWKPFEGVKLFENGQVIDEPRLTSEQWEIVSRAKELPKTIIIDDNFISLNCNYTADCGDKSFYDREVKPIIDATFNKQIDVACPGPDDDIIPVYSLALVRNPRMRVSKKKLNAEADKQEAIEIEIEVNPDSEGDDMPYRIRERNDEFCVVKINPDDTETIEKCHENMEMAQAHLDALNINVVAEEEESAMDTDKLKKRKPDKKEVDDSTFLKRLKLAAKNILDIVTLAEKESTNNEDDKLFMSDVGIGQKIVNGELWHFTYSTNAFQDREGEIFSTKALEDYVANNEVSKDKGYFNLWHINEEDGNFNTDFARKEWQGVVGRFLVEAGPYLRNEKGRAARKFFKNYPSGHPEIAPEGWGCSPEFRYLPEERATGTYDTIWITRTSTLPKFAAANVWTETRQMKHRGNNMLTKQQREAAEAIFGSDFVGSLIQEAESKTAELEAAGVAHKEKKEEPEPETQQVNIGIDMEVLAAEVGKQFAANLDPIADAIATMADSVKQLQDRLDRLEKDSKVKAVTESPRYVFNLKRASDAETTIVTEDDKLSKQKPVETTKANANDPWSQMFNK